MVEFAVPKWIKALPYSNQIVAFLSDPRTWVVGIVYEVFVGGLLDLAAGVLGNLQTVFGLLAGIPLDVAGIVSTAFGAAGAAVLTVFDVVASIASTLIATAGPFGPILLALFVLAAAEFLRRVGPLVVETISPRLAAVLAFLIPGGSD